MFFSYVTLVVLSVPMVQWLGMLGFLYTWLGVEVFQIVRIIGLNKQMFAHTGQHRLTYVYRLIALSGIGLWVAGVILSHTYQDLYRWQFAAAFGMSAALSVAAFFLFDMRIIVMKLWTKMRHQTA
jgi:hypothetical protein